jgi:hypothetical protein
MTLKQISSENNIPYWRVCRVKELILLNIPIQEVIERAGIGQHLYNRILTLIAYEKRNRIKPEIQTKEPIHYWKKEHEMDMPDYDNCAHELTGDELEIYHSSLNTTVHHNTEINTEH